MDRVLIKVVNQKFNLVTLLRKAGHRIDRVPVTLLCPFHDDSSKSAKIFEDGHLYCWTCHRQFGAYDALQLLGVSDGEIKRMLSTMGEISLEEEEGFSTDEESAKTLISMFRLGKIPLRKMLDGLYLMMRGKKT